MALFVVGYITCKVPNTVVLASVLGYIPGLAGLIGILTLPLSDQLNLAACAWMLPITSISVVMLWGIVGTNFAGHTKRTFANANLFVSYSAGQIISPFFFEPYEAPRYATAIKALIGVFAAGIIFSSLFGLYMWRENVKRSKVDIQSTVAVDKTG